MQSYFPDTDNLLFDANALRVLKERYLLTDPDTGVQETPREMLERVAKAIAKGNKYYENAFFDMMANLDFLPNSPTLMNAGRPGKQAQLAACYVLDVPDSMEGIYDALKYQALIHKSGGGTGFNFSKLRPKGAPVASTNGVASGPLSFMELFDVSTEKVMQGGMRRGANMGILNCDHPDILEFIEAKDRDNGKLTNFNISVGLTDDFMTSVADGKKQLPGLEDVEQHFKRLEVWEAIVNSAWRTGDPGVIYLDAINRANPTPQLGQLEATNPCGETPLYPNEACNLGSVNLSNFVKRHDFNKSHVIDYRRLSEVVTMAVRFLDNVIDVNAYPLPEIRDAVRKTRKIGLGVMGWADMLFKLGVRYGSDESFALARAVMAFIDEAAKRASVDAAFYYGPCGPDVLYQGCYMRNTSVTCIAPTGTISLLAGCSSGIEPHFALSYSRVCFDKDEDSHGDSKRQVLTITNQEYEKALNDPSDTRIADGVFVTAHEIPPKQHIAMQAAFQKHVDLAVSKTVNLPNSATKRDVADAYITAWRSGCKGTTIYRDGCRNAQVLYSSQTPSDSLCPQCSAKAVIHQDGCKKCTVCGWSPCAVS